jgi:UDPglucose 6-dehydrogenase|tara:strand:- start:1439 stop:2584 length:1146 start_codon:yes stop_codon:yes gene_type:complete
MKVGFVGLGKLVKPCSDVAYEKGHDVTGYDPKVSNLAICRKNLFEAISDREIIFVSVPTPHEDGYGGETPTSDLPAKDFDYSAVEETLSELNKFVKKPQLIVLISNVIPTTIDNKLRDLITDADFVYSPFFIAQGTVAWDFKNPELFVIGADRNGGDGSNGERPNYRPKILIDFYKTIAENNPRIQICNFKEAEMIKVFYNTFITQKINFVNMIQHAADKMKNADANFVCDVLSKCTHRLISPKYMKPGLGDGGSCHPRDNIALSWLTKKLDMTYDYFGNTMIVREKQAEAVARRVLQDPSGKVQPLKVAFTSTGFKEGVKNEDGSYILLIQHYIKELGGKIVKINAKTGCDILFKSWPSDETPENIEVFDIWKNYGNDHL